MKKSEYRILMLAQREGSTDAYRAADVFDTGGNHAFRDTLRAWDCLRRLARRGWLAHAPATRRASRNFEVVFRPTQAGLCACSLYRDQLRRRIEERYRELAGAV